MRLNKQQLKLDILFIMSTRSAKWWRGKELCPYLSQLGHDQPTPKKIKDVLTDFVENKVLERTKVKPQWHLYAYKMTGRYDHNTLPLHGGASGLIHRTAGDNIW